jgi:hypothetical protein
MSLCKFLNPEAVEEAIAEVARVAKAEGVDVALIGGVAMEVYGSDRLTKDVDFAAEMYVPGMPILRELPYGGFASETSRGQPVDVVVRDDEYADLYRSAIYDSINMDLPVKVVTPEHLAALKMAAGRGKDDINDMAWD